MLNAKQSIISALLVRLREHNNTIGKYEKSILSSNYNYIVRLDNGKIELTAEIVDDFETAPEFVDEAWLLKTAYKFIPDKKAEYFHSEPVETAKIIPAKKYASKFWIYLLLLAGLAVVVLIFS